MANAALGTRIIELLRTRDVDTFAAQISPSATELKTLLRSNDSESSAKAFEEALTKRGIPAPRGKLLNPDDHEQVEAFATHQRLHAADIAHRLLATATALGLDPTQVHLDVKAFELEGVPLSPESRTHLQANRPYVNGIKVPAAGRLSILLRAEPLQDGNADAKLRGEYEITLFRPRLFPAGWRMVAGIPRAPVGGTGAVWNRAPDGLAEPGLQWELDFLNTLQYLPSPLTVTDDPALDRLGNTLIRFLKTRSESTLLSEAIPAFDTIVYERLRNSVPDADQLPPRAELQEIWNKKVEEFMLKPARKVLSQMDELGLDFSNAEVKLEKAIAVFDPFDVSHLKQSGSLDGISIANPTFTLSVKSDHRSSGGTPVIEEYSLVVGRIERLKGRWLIMRGIAWDQLPNVSEGTRQATEIALEKHVAKYGTLPPGTVAPKLQVTRLDDAAKLKLSDFKGRIVVLEWWATWCAPCQKPMADLQSLVMDHPNWENRVEVIAISVDDKPSTVRNHLTKHGWNRTSNTWAGEGGSLSDAAQTFRISKFPTSYIIDPSGRIDSVDLRSVKEITRAIERLLGTDDAHLRK